LHGWRGGGEAGAGNKDFDNKKGEKHCQERKKTKKDLRRWTA